MFKPIKTLSLLLCAVLLVSILVACNSSGNLDSTTTTPPSEQTVLEPPVVESQSEETDIDRYIVEAKTEQLLSNYLKDTNNSTAIYEYAENLFQLGNFEEAKEIVTPLISSQNAAKESKLLAGKIFYVQGDYIASEKLFTELVEQTDGEMQEKAAFELLLTYYQTNDYQKGSVLYEQFKERVEFPMGEVMKAFGNEKPYQIDWDGQDKAVVPMYNNEIIPTFTAKINDTEFAIILDTGGDVLVLEEDFARSLGLTDLSTGSGNAGEVDNISYGLLKVDSFEIGGIKISSLPAMALPYEFGTVGDHEIRGVIGTQFLKQFLSTIDIANSEMTLRPRNEVARVAFEEALSKEKVSDSFPFSLALTHYMISRATVNDKDNMNIFLDSGAVDFVHEASFLLPQKTLEYTGIGLPKELVKDDSGFSIGYFDVDYFQIGNFEMKNGVGRWEPEIQHTQSLYFIENNGFFIDGIVGHHFMKHYKMTYDFDKMTVILSQ